MTAEDEQEFEIDWTGIKPSERDDYQIYVLVAHVLVGVVVSVMSFTGDLELWMVGTGVMLPTLIIMTGLAYQLPTGINWYRDEFLPFVERVQSISAEESERFLRFQRGIRFSALVSGYLATGICQVVWTLLYNTFSPLWGGLSSPSDPLLGLLAGVAILFIVLWFILMAFFEMILGTVFPGTNHLAKLENQMNSALSTTVDDSESK